MVYSIRRLGNFYHDCKSLIIGTVKPVLSKHLGWNVKKWLLKTGACLIQVISTVLP